MSLSEYDFRLPESLIALRPAKPRTCARLLVYENGSISDRTVDELPDLLRPGDLLVLNDTRVLFTALKGERVRPVNGNDNLTKTAIKMNLVQRLGQGRWRAFAKPARRLRAGDSIIFSLGLAATVVELNGRDGCVVEFNRSGSNLEMLLEQIAEMPLPPYIASRREADVQDRNDYQSVFASKPGAVAAPTASLHFDAKLMSAIRRRGVRASFVTLHIGPGTFLPIRTNRIDDHKMHSEWGEISQEAAREINETKQSGNRVIPVGTTALRLIESASSSGGVRPWQGETDIFIKPGHRFNVADGLLTNFHLPQSTLLVLVSAFVGHAGMKAIYGHALDQRYRFLSYGDCSLLLP